MTHCNGKKIYKSSQQAKHVRNAIAHNRKRKLRVYPCNKCFGYHLTKTPNEKYI